MTILFDSNIIIRIRYNDYNQYSYQIEFSNDRLDRIRFDNYDDKWSVGTAPHHLHLRWKKEAMESKMSGEPENDFKILKIYLQEVL